MALVGNTCDYNNMWPFFKYNVLFGSHSIIFQTKQCPCVFNMWMENATMAASNPCTQLNVLQKKYLFVAHWAKVSPG